MWEYKVLTHPYIHGNEKKSRLLILFLNYMTERQKYTYVRASSATKISLYNPYRLTQHKPNSKNCLQLLSKLEKYTNL